MRIALNGRFLAAFPTGVERFAREISRRLVEQADVVILLPSGAALPAELAGSAVVSGRARGHVWEQLELPRLARGAGCTVTLNLANALPLAGGPHVVVLHDASVVGHPEWFGFRYRTWHGRVLFTAAKRAAVATVSEAARGALARALRRRPDEIPIVSQGAAPLDVPAAPYAVLETRRRYGLEGPYLLALGAGDPRKNLAFLLGLLPRWGERARSGEPIGPPPSLVMAGERATRVFAGGAGYQPTGAEMTPGREARVVWAGAVSDDTLRALYTGASAFCFPSLEEGFGRPPLEALACGAPVVCAPYGAAAEVLGDAALLLPLDVDGWISALAALVRGGRPPALAASVRAVLARHSWEAGCRTTLDLCGAVSQGARGAASPGARPEPPVAVRPVVNGGRR